MSRSPLTRARRPGLARWWPTALAITCVFPACHPRDGRLLVLDLNRAEPGALEGTARPWRDAGYRVESRSSYPHLTHDDLERYFTVVVLGGRSADPAAERLGAGDLVLLGEWVERGGVVVLGYAADEGAPFDRWMMNRWLVWRGAGITIGGTVPASAGPGGPPPPRDTPVAAVRGSALRGIGTHPFSAGRQLALAVPDNHRVLLRSVPGPHAEHSKGDAVLAASRLGRGLVVVASRHALQRPEPEGGARGTRPGITRLLTALARWSRRPAEWAGIPPASGDGPLVLLDGPGPVELLPPRRAPPPTAATIELLRP